MYIPRKRQFWSVGLGHMTNDIFMASGAIVLVFLSATIVPMSNTQIGFAIGMQQLSGALAQPIFGARADKTGGRVLGSGGLAWGDDDVRADDSGRTTHAQLLSDADSVFVARLRKCGTTSSWHVARFRI